jgi:ABC-2 type transport system permease protein
LTGVAQVLGVPLAIFVISAPATAPLMLGIWWNRAEVAGVGVLVGLVYAAGVCGVAIRWAGAQLTRREPEVLEAAKVLDS